MANCPELVFAPLGGVGEIGMNLALYGFGPADAREFIMVDCGVTFRRSGSAGRRPGAARHPLPRGESRRAEGHRHHPRPRGPLRRAARPLAAAEGPMLDDAVRRRPARSQAPVRARRARGAGDDLPGRREIHGRAVLDRGDPRRPFDPRADGAGDLVPRRHGRPHRRLEDRAQRRDRTADRRGSGSARSAMLACWRWSAIPPMRCARASPRPSRRSARACAS